MFSTACVCLFVCNYTLTKCYVCNAITFESLDLNTELSEKYIRDAERPLLSTKNERTWLYVGKTC